MLPGARYYDAAAVTALGYAMIAALIIALFCTRTMRRMGT
jgi:hypothetical protein